MIQLYLDVYCIDCIECMLNVYIYIGRIYYTSNFRILKVLQFEYSSWIFVVFYSWKNSTLYTFTLILQL